MFGAKISDQERAAVGAIDFAVLAADPPISNANIGLRSTPDAKRKAGQWDFTTRYERVFGDQSRDKAHGRVTCGKDSMAVGGLRKEGKQAAGAGELAATDGS